MAKADKGPIGNAVIRTFTMKSTAGLRGYSVKSNGTEDQVVLSGANDASLGVLQEGIAQDAPGPVVLFGETIAIAGGAINQGDWVKADGSGKHIASAGEDVANVGRAMSAAAADTDEFVLFVNPVKKRS